MNDRTTFHVLRIHGTFAAREQSDGVAWWQRQSDYHQWLDQELATAQAGACAAEVFHWDGLNSEYGRRNAGRELRDILTGYEREGKQYALIGHSHGGSVLWDALCQTETLYPGLPNLHRWVTLGTPFLLYRPEYFAVLLSAVSPFGAVLAFIWLIPTAWIVYRTYAADFLTASEYWFWGIAPALLVVLLALVTVAVLQFVVTLRNAFNEANRIRHHRRAYEALKGRYVPIMATADEAINGITATFAFSGEVVPRIGTRWMRVFSRLISSLADQVVWLQLSRRAQGSDIPGIVLDDVLPLPRREVAPRLLSGVMESALIARAEQRAQSALSAVRQSLAKMAFEGRPLSFLTAAAGESGAAESLVHTSYFDEPSVRQLTLSALTDPVPPHDTSTPILFPQAKRRIPAGRTVRLLFAVLYLFCISLLSVAASGILSPLRPEVMIEDAVRRAPLANAIWEDPDTPQAFLRAVGRAGNASLVQLVLQRLSQAPDRARARTHLAFGLLDGGNTAEAAGLLVIAGQEANLRPQQQPGVNGPVLPLSFTAIDLAHAYARVGDLADLEMLLSAFAGSNPEGIIARSSLERAAIAGFAESRNFDQCSRYLTRIGDVYQQRDAFLDILQARPELEHAEAALAVLSAEMQQEVLGEVFFYLAQRNASASLLPRLSEVERAKSFVTAVSAVARLLHREGHTGQALTLLEDAVTKLPKRTRTPLDGHAILYARLAEAFLDLGSTGKASELLEFAQALGPERVGDYVYDDDSIALRAELWARLGNTKQALATAQRIVIDKEPGIRNTTRLLARAGQASQVRPGVDRWKDRAEQLEAMLGLLDSQLSLSSAHRDSLRSLEKEIRLLDDPKLRSKYMAEIGLQWVKAKNTREAIRIADTCAPADNLLVLTHLLNDRSSSD